MTVEHAEQLVCRWKVWCAELQVGPVITGLHGDRMPNPRFCGTDRAMNAGKPGAGMVFLCSASCVTGWVMLWEREAASEWLAVPLLRKCPAILTCSVTCGQVVAEQQ